MSAHPSAAAIRARIGSWFAGDWPEGTEVHQALGWSEREFAAWYADRSAVPARPLPPCPMGPGR